MTLDLHGAVALIAGAATPDGAATAADLARLGASVAILDGDREALDELAAAIEAAGGHVLSVAADLTDRASARTAVGWVVSRGERLDIVVIVGAADPTATVSRAAIQHLRMAGYDSPRGSADLINVGSASPIGADERRALAAANVRVRSVVPGRSVADMVAGFDRVA